MVDPERAEVVRLISDSYSGGASQYRIAKELTAAGQTTPGASWHAQRIGVNMQRRLSGRSATTAPGEPDARRTLRTLLPIMPGRVSIKYRTLMGDEVGWGVVPLLRPSDSVGILLPLDRVRPSPALPAAVAPPLLLVHLLRGGCRCPGRPPSLKKRVPTCSP